MSDAIAVHHGAYGRCGLYSLNRSLPTHVHLESHLIFSLSGQPAKLKIEDTDCTVCTETVVAINPLQPHSQSIDRSDGDSVVLVLYIKPAWLEKMRGTNQTVRFTSNDLSLIHI